MLLPSKEAVLPCGMGGTGGFGGPLVGSGGLGGCGVDGVLGPQTSNKKSLLYFEQTLSKSKLVSVFGSDLLNLA